MSTVVSDNKRAHRYELFDDGELVGFADYEVSGDRMAVLHVEIVQSRSNQGLGTSPSSQACFDDAGTRIACAAPVFVCAVPSSRGNKAAYLDLVPSMSGPTSASRVIACQNAGSRSLMGRQIPVFTFSKYSRNTACVDR